MSIEEFADLATTGYTGGTGEKTAPEDEMFHSAYIAGKSRMNHINVKEQLGKFQIRGVEYNLETINMIITHTKEILVNVERVQNKDNIKCFSFKDGSPPWFGTTLLSSGNKRQCPQTSAERAINDFCSPCKTQIIVAGIFCKPDGTPIVNEENKPVFIFIRGKGMRYSNVSQYLNDLYQEDLTPIFEPATEQSKSFEKSVVNNKRFVTKLTVGEQTSSFGGNVFIFELNKGTELPKESVLSVLKLSKKTVEQFNEKFDWSKRKQSTSTYNSESSTPPEGILTIGDGKQEAANDTGEKAVESGVIKGKNFSFDDINF